MPSPPPAIPSIEIGDSYLPLFGRGLGSRFILVEGVRGSGKTRAILTWIMTQALAHPGSRWLLARSTRTRLYESVMTTLEGQVFPAFGLPVPGASGSVNRTAYPLPGGSKLIVMGLDDQQRTQSVECAGIYVSEGVELAQADDVLALAGAMRQAVEGIPIDQMRCIVDANPGTPGHWLNQIAQDVPAGLRRVQTIADYRRVLAHNQSPAPAGEWKRIITRIQDNPAYFSVKKWGLTAAGEAYLGTLGYLSGHLRRRWLDGEWCTAEGVVFGQFDESAHVVEDFVVPADWPAILACDPGYDHPTAIVIGVLSPNGRLYLVGEYVRRETTIEQDAAWISQWEREHGYIIRRKLGDPHYIDHRTKHNSGVTIVDHMRTYGHQFGLAPAAHNAADLNAQVGMVRDWLMTRLGDGEPKMQVFRSCTMTINAFQSWSFRRNSRGEQTGAVDQYEETYKDEMDAVRMLVASNPRYAGQSWSVSHR